MIELDAQLAIKIFRSLAAIQMNDNFRMPSIHSQFFHIIDHR